MVDVNDEPLFRPDPQAPRFLSGTGATLTPEMVARAFGDPDYWTVPVLSDGYRELLEEFRVPVPDPDWTVQADGYRLVIKDGAMVGLAYDEFPWLWGDPRYDDTTVYSWMADGPFPDSAVLTPGALAAQPAADPPPGLPYRYFGICDE